MQGQGTPPLPLWLRDGRLDVKQDMMRGCWMRRQSLAQGCMEGWDWVLTGLLGLVVVRWPLTPRASSQSQHA